MRNKIIQFAWTALLIIMTCGKIYAQSTAEFSSGNTDSKSVEWQAIKFQEAIEDKINRTLNPILNKDQYIIEVQVKLDMLKAEDPTPKKKIKTTKSKKVQFSNTPFPQNGDDFVVFNKLGMEAPIVGEEPIVSEVSEAELNQKAAIELQERFNFFNYLESININIVFDDTIKEEVRKSVQMALDGISFYTRSVVPQYNISYVKLNGKAQQAEDDKKKQAAAQQAQSDKEAEEKRIKDDIASKEESIQEKITEKAPAKIDRFQNLDVMIGLIAAALILGMVGIYVANVGLKQEQDIESKNQNNDTTTEEVNAQNNNEDDVTEESESEELVGEEEGDMIDLSGDDAVTLKINQNLERLRTVLKHHHGETILMIKDWIRSSSEPLPLSALRALVEVLNDNELSDIFKHLTFDERGSWKMVLDGEMTKPEVAKAFVFVGNEIVKTMMLPSIIDDFEICNLLLTVSPEDAAKYCKQHPQLGVVFANVLSGKIISEMFKLLPAEMTVNIIQRSTVFKKDEITSQLPLLKKVLLEASGAKERPPFLKRIIEILPGADIEIEQQLYATLLTHMSVEECTGIALHVLPNKVINDLPPTSFLMVMDYLKPEERLNYLAILSEHNREERLDKMAPRGTKAREVLEMELESILADELQMRRLSGQASKESIRGNFLKAAREFVSTNQVLKQEIAPVLSEWLFNIKQQLEHKTKKAA